MGTITAINGVGHVAGRPSHPKLFARIGVGKNRVDPLGLFAVVRARRFLPRDVWRRSIAAGVAINAGIGLLALPLSRKVVRRIDDGSGESIT